MRNKKQENRPVAFESAATDAELLEQLEAYLQSCHPTQNEDRKKTAVPFPNLAGFCRWLGWGGSEMELLKKSAPELYDRICTVLEDEALNSEISASVLTAYLKKRLGYSESDKVEKSEVESGQLRLIFDHDILSDGE